MDGGVINRVLDSKTNRMGRSWCELIPKFYGVQQAETYEPEFVDTKS